MFILKYPINSNWGTWRYLDYYFRVFLPIRHLSPTRQLCGDTWTAAVGAPALAVAGTCRGVTLPLAGQRRHLTSAESAARVGHRPCPAAVHRPPRGRREIFFPKFCGCPRTGAPAQQVRHVAHLDWTFDPRREGNPGSEVDEPERNLPPRFEKLRNRTNTVVVLPGIIV